MNNELELPKAPSLLVYMGDAYVNANTIISITKSSGTTQVIVSSGLSTGIIDVSFDLDDAINAVHAWQQAQIDYQEATREYFEAKQRRDMEAMGLSNGGGYPSAPTPLHN